MELHITRGIRRSAILALAVLWLYAALAAAEPRRVRAACNLPLTGPLATYGTAVQEGVLFELEQAQPKASSPAIQYAWDDNRSQPKEALSVLRRQLLERPALYVSGVRPQYEAIRREAAAAGIPHFVWVFDRILRPNHENNFRTWVNFKAEPPLFVEYAKRIKPGRIAIVYVALPHTDEEYNTVVIPGLRAAGFGEITVEPYQMDKLDFKDIALRLRRFAPDLLILSGFQENLIAMIREFNAARLLRPGNALASYDLLDAAAQLAPAEIEGMHVTAPRFVLEPDDPAVAAWSDRFRRRFSKPPLYTHAYAYDMAAIIADAAARVTDIASPRAWRQALEQTDLAGISGRLRFDGEGDLIPEVELGVFRSGKPVRDRAAGPR